MKSKLMQAIEEIRAEDRGIHREDEGQTKTAAAEDIDTEEKDDSLSDVIVHERFVTGLGERR